MGMTISTCSVTNERQRGRKHLVVKRRGVRSQEEEPRSRAVCAAVGSDDDEDDEDTRSPPRQRRRRRLEDEDAFQEDEEEEEEGDPMDVESSDGAPAVARRQRWRADGSPQYYAYDERHERRHRGVPFPQQQKQQQRLLTSGQGTSQRQHEEQRRQPLRRLAVRNAPEAFVQMSSELVVVMLRFLSVQEQHSVASNALCRRHACRVRDQRDVWLPLCAAPPWRIRAVQGKSAADLRAMHRGVLAAVEKARRGTVFDVAKTMFEFQDVAGVQRRCLERLVAMLHCERVRKQALGSRVTEAVVSAVRNFHDDASLQAVALHCVVFLARPIGGAEGMVFSRGMASEGVDAFLRGGIDGVLAAMAAHVEDADVQAMGCWSLVNLALNRKQKLLLLDKSCLDRVLDAMSHHPRILEVQFRALFALINLVIPETNDNFDNAASRTSGSYDHHSGLLDDDHRGGSVLDRALAAMHTFYESDKLIRCGCLVLHNLSLREANIPHLLAAGVQQPLERAARNHKDHDVQRSAASTLRRLGLPLLHPNSLGVGLGAV